MKIKESGLTDYLINSIYPLTIILYGSFFRGEDVKDSDIDLIIHTGDDAAQNEPLDLWLEGWSLCLSEMNYLSTGYKSEGLLDVHYVTDADIENKTSYAVKIGAITDAAKPLRVVY